jgi:hypothetical protein
MSFLDHVKARLLPFFDPSAWVLVLVALLPLWFIDPGMVLTLGQWTAFALALAGISVVICRVTLPQLNLGALLDQVRTTQNPLPAALVVAAVILYLAAIFVGLVLWAKA